MYDLLQENNPTVNKSTNACLKRITWLFYKIKYLANWALSINVHNSIITQLDLISIGKCTDVYFCKTSRSSVLLVLRGQ